jgi:hypothetical protein
LGQLEAFLREAGAIAAYDGLLDDLLSTVIPNLEKFPDMGRDFLARPAGSVEVAQGVERLSGTGPFRHLREYVLPPYLLLYATGRQTVDLLSIRHHRQLSFDFPGLWNDV